MNAGRFLVAVIPMVLGASLALAEQAPPAPEAKKSPAAEPKASTAPAAPAPAAGGLVVFIDPVTGKIRQPDAAEIGALVTAPGAVSPPVGEPLLTLSLPGGGVAVRLDRSFESSMVMTRAPDGKLVMQCVTGEKQAQEAVAAGSKAAAKAGGREATDVP